MPIFGVTYGIYCLDLDLVGFLIKMIQAKCSSLVHKTKKMFYIILIPPYINYIRAIPSAPQLSDNLTKASIAPATHTTKFWHQRITHLKLPVFSRQIIVTGLLPLPRVKPYYEACVLGKQHQTPIPIVCQTMIL
jgi:hypothetical protein